MLSRVTVVHVRLECYNESLGPIKNLSKTLRSSCRYRKAQIFVKIQLNFGVRREMPLIHKKELVRNYKSIISKYELFLCL